MDNQSFELRRLGLRAMVGQEQFIDLYDSEFDDLMAELRADPDEDRRQAQINRLKTDGKHQIGFLLGLYYQGIANGEDKNEAETMQG